MRTYLFYYSNKLNTLGIYLLLIGLLFFLLYFCSLKFCFILYLVYVWKLGFFFFFLSYLHMLNEQNLSKINLFLVAFSISLSNPLKLPFVAVADLKDR